MSKTNNSDRVAVGVMEMLVRKVGTLCDAEGLDPNLAVIDVARGAAIYLAVACQSMFGTEQGAEMVSGLMNRALEASPGFIAKARKGLLGDELKS